MKRLLALMPPIAAVLALAACGGSSGSSGSAGSGANSQTVAVHQLPQVGSVLVDHSGKALYSNDLEAGGMIVCDAGCDAFWKPLTPGGAKPTASAGAGKLGVVTRPDGTKQVTDNGKPLYTFVEDSPGKVTGNDFKDAFAGHHFTWTVARAADTNTAGARSGTGASTPSGTGSSGGGYGY